ncbi:MAG: S16 family serine protease [Nanoarchaeota archaeon]|nr:S16 family serine protease [Nanoarchaeota archaeon]
MKTKKPRNLSGLWYVTFFLLGFIVASSLYYAPYLTKEAKLLGREDFQPLHETIPILAVSVQKHQGIVGYANVDIRPSESNEGRILIETNPFVEPDTQYSANTAVKVAENVTNISMSNKEIIFSFDTGSIVIGGPSAGAAMTLLMISALTGRQIKDDVMITGTISPDGRIGQIGNVIEKSDAAGVNKTKILLVPPGQRTLTYYDKKMVEKKVDGKTAYASVYIPKHLDINEYTRETYNMSVKEVSQIEDVMRYMLEESSIKN